MSIERELNKYLSDLHNNKLPLPEACQRCHKREHLIWWSKYRRRLITFAKVFTDIPIKRVRCHACGATFCSLPDFIIKFCHYGKDIIVFALRKLKKLTYEKAVEKLLSQLNADIEIAARTLFSWKRKYSSTGLILA